MFEFLFGMVPVDPFPDPAVGDKVDDPHALTTDDLVDQINDRMTEAPETDLSEQFGDIDAAEAGEADTEGDTDGDADGDGGDGEGGEGGEGGK
jgi:hypothetical protein